MSCFFIAPFYHYCLANQQVCSEKTKIYIDSVYQSTLDLYSSTTLAQQAVYTKTHPSGGAHTIKVEVQATKNTKASGYFIPVDAFDVTN